MALRYKLAACSHSTPFVQGHCKLSQEDYSLKQNTFNKATKEKTPPLREAHWVKDVEFFKKKLFFAFCKRPSPGLELVQTHEEAEIGNSQQFIWTLTDFFFQG